MGLIQWWKSITRTIPTQKDALSHINGEIITISGNKYFKDKTGNSRHLLITNYDFPTNWNKGFPYKSAATISAPIGDVTLIAADLNYYLYASGSNTPNQIPVVSLYQDIDYEHKFFCRHVNQVLDSNGVEIYEPRVMEVVLYNNVKTGNQLTSCQTYFKTPIEATSAVRWCSKVGNDSPNTGTKLSPWLTQIKVNAGSTNGDVSYTKTGVYKEATYLQATKLIDFHAIGFNTIQSNSTSYNILTQTNGNTVFHNWIIDAEEVAATNLTLYRNNNNAYNCFIKNAKTTLLKIDANSNGSIVQNTIISGSKPILVNNAGYFNTCYFDSCYFTIASTCTSLTILNSKFNYNRASTDITIAYDFPTIIRGNTINITTAYNFMASNIENINSDLDFSFNKVTALDFSNVGVLQIIKSFANITINNNDVNLTNGQFILLNTTRNSVISNNIVTTAENESVEIYNGAAGVVGTHIISNNKIFGKYDNGHIIKIGDEASTVADNTISSVLINNNYVRGNKYYYPTNNVICHGLFVGFQGIPIVIKHNYLSYNGENVLKGSNSDYSNCHIWGNLIKNQQNYGMFLKGVDSSVITNNTFIENGQAELYFTENVGSDGTNGNVIKNNIFINTTGLLVNFLTTSCATNTLDYNIYYSTVAKPFSINGATKTWEEWQLLGYDEHSIFLTTEQFNNLFTDYANGDYSLKIGSTAIGVGLTLDAAYDDGLNASTNWGNDVQLPIVITKQQGVSWDIGAYIY